MSAKLLVWVMIAWLTFSFSDWLVSNLVDSTSDIDVIFSLQAVNTGSFSVLNYKITFVIPNGQYITSLWNLASWNWWFFNTEPTIWVRYFFGLPMTGILTYYVYNNLIPVFMSVLGAAGSIIRAVNPLSWLKG